MPLQVVSLTPAPIPLLPDEGSDVQLSLAELFALIAELEIQAAGIEKQENLVKDERFTRAYDVAMRAAKDRIVALDVAAEIARRRIRVNEGSGIDSHAVRLV